MNKLETMILIGLGIASNLSAKSDDYIVITENGIYKEEISTAGRKQGNCIELPTLHSFYYPWSGEDSIDYRLEDGILWINDQIRGADLSIVKVSNIPDAKKIATVFMDGVDTSELLKLPGLKAVKIVPLTSAERNIAGILRIKGIEALSLSLYINDSLYSMIKDLTNVKQLGLSGTYLTDDNLADVGAMKDLEVLNLSYNTSWFVSPESEITLSLTDKGLSHLQGLTKLRDLDISFTEITDAGLVHLKNSSLQRLNLSLDAITDSGLVSLETLDDLISLDLSSTKVTNKGLRYLKNLPELRELDLSWLRIDDAGIAYLKDLTEMRKLNLSRTEVTDAGLAYLQGMAKMRDLDLASSAITDTSLANLQKMTDLRSLNLGLTGITDDGLVYLSKLTNLRKLNIGETFVTGSGLARLRGLSNLVELNLQVSNLNEQSLACLQDFPNLRVLSLAGPNLTDKGLQHLYKLRGLKRINLFATVSITENGIEELKKALPDCEVHAGAPPY